MNKVFVVKNQHGLYLSKQHEWVSGEDNQQLYRSAFKDEAINTVFEVSAKDIYLRATAVACPVDARNQPRVDPAAQAELAIGEADADADLDADIGPDAEAEAEAEENGDPALADDASTADAGAAAGTTAAGDVPAAPADDGARAAIAAAMRELAQRGLNTGASGNISLRHGDGLLITPTGVAPAQLTADGIVQLDAGGGIVAGALRPSSEWQLHAAVYRARPDLNAVVHCHSRYATALACCGRELPAFHYMIAAAGGAIRCAPYALFGSAELADHACRALQDRRACLLANHGQLATGATLAQALELAVLVEELAATYCACLHIGGVQLLDNAQMAAVTARFAGYGQPSPR